MKQYLIRVTNGAPALQRADPAQVRRSSPRFRPRSNGSPTSPIQEQAGLIDRRLGIYRLCRSRDCRVCCIARAHVIDWRKDFRIATLPLPVSAASALRSPLCRLS
jgi:hypothetical protein